jgi:hypothetical protein
VSTITRRAALGALAAMPAAATATHAASSSLMPAWIDPADLPDRYAVTCRGTCMVPLLPDGATLVFDRHVEPSIGDTVAVLLRREFRDATARDGLVKRLLELPGDNRVEWVFDQLNPPLRYRIPAAHVAAIHVCIGVAESNDGAMSAFRVAQERPRAPLIIAGSRTP